MPDSKRIRREKQTVQLMIEMYCHAHHGTKQGMCDTCRSLQTYALQRIDKCRLRFAKPTCANCEIHCYSKEMREKIREVMRFSGPKMAIHHPVLAILHLIDGFKRR